jgi:hypothetical protein
MGLITDYASLQTEVANWLNRAGDSAVTSNVAAFIANFEQEFAGDPRCRFRQMETTAPITINAETVALPSDYLELRDLRITSTDPIGDLDYAPPDWLNRWQGLAATAQPRYYDIKGGNLIFRPIPDTSYTGEIDYYAFAALSGTNTTNWLVTAYPNLYLYGSLEQAKLFLDNAPAAQLWQAKKEALLARLIAADKQARWAGTPLVMRSDLGCVG